MVQAIAVGLSPDSEGRAPYHFSIPLTQTVLQILPERGWATCASTLSAECVNTIVFVRHTAFSTHRSSHRACSGRDSAIVASRKISMRWGRLYLDILLRLTANRVLLSSAAFTSEHSGLLTRYKSSACTLTEATTKGASTVATDRVFDLLQALVTPKRRGAYEARNLVPGIWESLVDDTSFCNFPYYNSTAGGQTVK
ncbi:hypothetical protein DOTSEDRAFT_82582 [Dothistroma septosporum NZE10]|uniref:Uncharacterized protein n=1 Tax=Dothistroma septosporum (strain NZE10 / CBS 128990) TaxID=675120 RepID=N1PC65_DOTSN|nr:hypothetical protein DOTSEDRAFT_82582 [Dothistroma septosporum NZE10]